VATDLLDAVYGCLIGGAVGDALGAPVENWHYADIRERHGKVTEFMPREDAGRARPAGSVTDDSAIRHYMCLAIVRKRGRIGPEDYAAVWLEKANPDRLFFTEQIVLQKLRHGMSPWETGRGQPMADAAVMSIAPIGIINAGDPEQAYQDAFILSLMQQDMVERDAAATIASAFAAAFHPESSAASVLDTMLEHSSPELERRLTMAMDLAAESEGVDEFTERFYASMLDFSFPLAPEEEWDRDRSPSPTSREVLPAVAAIFHLCGGEPDRCIVEGASFGRDCDTIATLAGGLAGALRGAGAIRTDWIADCEAANEDLFVEVEDDPRQNFYAMAERLVEALRSERRSAQARVELLDRIIG
jgi:ADP-ribosylglycohydrolase